MQPSLRELLKKALHENKFELTDTMQEQLLSYLGLLLKWNRVFNLTALTAPHDLVYLHLIDSLVVQPYLNGDHMLDVGSGAGLPGIPLAIANPSHHWTLLDKNNKKTRFLVQVVAELGLKQVNIVHARCEEFHPTKCFDTILSRAFGTLRLFAEITSHLLCQNGKLIAMKGAYPKAEIEAIPSAFQLLDVARLVIKGTEIERHLVILKRRSLA